MKLGIGYTCLVGVVPGLPKASPLVRGLGPVHRTGNTGLTNAGGFKQMAGMPTSKLLAREALPWQITCFCLSQKEMDHRYELST